MKASDLKIYLETVLEQYGDHEVAIGTLVLERGNATLQLRGFSIAVIENASGKMRSIIADDALLSAVPKVSPKLELVRG